MTVNVPLKNFGSGVGVLAPSSDKWLILLNDLREQCRLDESQTTHRDDRGVQPEQRHQTEQSQPAPVHREPCSGTINVRISHPTAKASGRRSDTRHE
eukprot:2573077-Rhodomonas_salina.1